MKSWIEIYEKQLLKVDFPHFKYKFKDTEFLVMTAFILFKLNVFHNHILLELKSGSQLTFRSLWWGWLHYGEQVFVLGLDGDMQSCGVGVFDCHAVQGRLFFSIVQLMVWSSISFHLPWSVLRVLFVTWKEQRRQQSKCLIRGPH